MPTTRPCPRGRNLPGIALTYDEYIEKRACIGVLGEYDQSRLGSFIPACRGGLNPARRLRARCPPGVPADAEAREW